MSTPVLVPMLSPDGQSGDIPADKVKDAIAAGFQRATVMTSPDGQTGYIPQNRAYEAMKSGFKIGPASQQEKPESLTAQIGGVLGGLTPAGVLKKAHDALGTAADYYQQSADNNVTPDRFNPVTDYGKRVASSTMRLGSSAATPENAVIAAGAVLAPEITLPYLAATGTTQALTPRQQNETQADALERRLMGASQVVGSVAGATESPTTLTERGVNAARNPRVTEKLQASAAEQYQKALNPTKERTKYLADKRTQEMMGRGITMKSAGELAERAQGEARALNTKLNDIYESLPADRQSPTAPMLQALDEYKAQFQDRVPITEQQLRGELLKNKGRLPANIIKEDNGGFARIITLDENAVAAADSMKKIIGDYGDSISPKSMRRARQVFDEAVSKAGGYEGRSLAEGSLVDAKAEAAAAIREQLAKDNPELVPLNKEINFWLDVQRVAKETAQRKVGQQGGLTVTMAKHTGQAIGAGVGYAVGGPVGAAGGAYFGGATAARMAKVTQSPKWRTVSAVAKNRLAESLASGRMKNVNLQLDFLDRQYGLSAATAAAAASNNRQ